MLTVIYPSRQLSIANSLPAIGSVPLFGIRSKRLNTRLLMETTMVTIAAILAIKVFGASSIFKPTWFAAPGILIAAALIPTAIKRRDFARIGLNNKKISHSLVLLGWACIATFPATFCGLWLMRYWGLELSLRSVLPPAQGWFSWLLYQFMYIAVAEEIFFRGYVQNNILRLISAIVQERRRLLQWTSIITSAVCFAVAHTIVQGEIISVLTFLPGLVLGWLFVRTRSLLAPILFHGLANVFYLCVVSMFV
jgi:membrane protease YdiL (CAAX protease family)